MALISYWQVPDEWIPLVSKILQWNDRYRVASIRKKPGFFSVKRRQCLTLSSLQPRAAEEWAKLSQVEKEAWASAATASNQLSFQLFLRDVAARVKNDLTLPGTPSDYAQYLCGRVAIEYPASGFLIKQEHPFSYFILRKVRGTRDQYDPVEVLEDFDLPFQIGISWHTDLTAVGPNPRARFFVEILSHYQGRDIVSEHSIEFGLQDSWRRDTLTISSVLGKPKGYTAYLDVQDAQGVMDWDNVRLFHSEVNFARDPKCDHVGTSYTGAFFMVAKNWEDSISPPGVFYDSIYYNL